MTALSTVLLQRVYIKNRIRCFAFLPQHLNLLLNNITDCRLVQFVVVAAKMSVASDPTKADMRSDIAAEASF